MEFDDQSVDFEDILKFNFYAGMNRSSQRFSRISIKVQSCPTNNPVIATDTQKCAHVASHKLSKLLYYHFPYPHFISFISNENGCRAIFKRVYPAAGIINFNLCNNFLYFIHLLSLSVQYFMNILCL